MLLCKIELCIYSLYSFFLYFHKYWGSLTFTVGGLFRSTDLATPIFTINNVARECEVAASGALGIKCLGELFVIDFRFLRIVKASGHWFRYRYKCIWFGTFLFFIVGEYVLWWQKSGLELFLFNLAFEAVRYVLGGGWMCHGLAILRLIQTVSWYIDSCLLLLIGRLLCMNFLWYGTGMSWRLAVFSSVRLYTFNINFTGPRFQIFFGAIIVIGFVIVIFEMVIVIIVGRKVSWERCYCRTNWEN